MEEPGEASKYRNFITLSINLYVEDGSLFWDARLSCSMVTGWYEEGDTLECDMTNDNDIHEPSFVKENGKLFRENKTKTTILDYIKELLYLLKSYPSVGHF